MRGEWLRCLNTYGSLQRHIYVTRTTLDRCVNLVEPSATRRVHNYAGNRIISDSCWVLLRPTHDLFALFVQIVDNIQLTQSVACIHGLCMGSEPQSRAYNVIQRNVMRNVFQLRCMPKRLGIIYLSLCYLWQRENTSVRGIPIYVMAIALELAL